MLKPGASIYNDKHSFAPLLAQGASQLALSVAPAVTTTATVSECYQSGGVSLTVSEPF